MPLMRSVWTVVMTKHAFLEDMAPNKNSKILEFFIFFIYLTLYLAVFDLQTYT